MFEKDFSHGTKFTGYMEIVVNLVEARPGGQKILDIPSGNGRLISKEIAHGIHVFVKP